jgi:hypothetical protein
MGMDVRMRWGFVGCGWGETGGWWRRQYKDHLRWDNRRV